jgi:hypothetical protein
MARIPKMSIQDLAKVSAELVQRLIILEPALPAELLAERIVTDEADSVFTSELSHSLLVGHFVRLIRSERRKKAPKRDAQFAMFEHLPVRITGERDHRVRLEYATYSDVRRYCKWLRKRYTDRKDSDVKLKEAQVLADRMKVANQRQRGITVGEMLTKGEGERGRRN